MTENELIEILKARKGVETSEFKLALLIVGFFIAQQLGYVPSDEVMNILLVVLQGSYQINRNQAKKNNF